jgi:GT2 family glycosyltransferase
MPPRILFAITVYNGRSFVPACLASAMRLDQTSADLDVLVLDDASPEPGWSAELGALCHDLGIQYYCSPRNLGIVRNVNLGLLRALSEGYDFVIISNSDVLYPQNLVESLLAVVATDESIASATAWSNNVSAYSLPNDDPDANLSDPDVVDWVSASLAGQFGTAAVDIPAGISFCILIRVSTLGRIGMMDPVFGRGYCEETDWSLRSLGAGYRLVLAPSAFVYHRGRGSTVEAGMISGGHTTVPANEAIIDLRYPLFRSQVGAFLSSDILPTLIKDGTTRILRDACRLWGYRLELTSLPSQPERDSAPRIAVNPRAGGPRIEATFRGFRVAVPLKGDDVVASVKDFAGGPPLQVRVLQTGVVSDTVLRGFADVPALSTYSYPERV